MRAEKRRGAPAPGQVIDIHAHYFPLPYLELLAAEGAKYGADFRRTEDGFFITGAGRPLGPLPLKLIDLAARVAEMDAQGVDLQALSLTSPMVYWAEPELSLRLARAFNDAASDAHRRYPDRFVGLIALPMLDTDRALAELERAAALPGMRGVYLGTNIEDRDLSDPLFTEVFARIEALGLPIFLHPLKVVGGKRLQPFHLGNLLGNPFDTAIAAAHLIFGGVLDRFPTLEINLPHAGGALPILIGRFDHGKQVRPELRALPRAPSEYLRRFTYDTIGHSTDIMRFVLSLVGADRVMLGSDYCFDMGLERPVEIVQALGLDNAASKQILGGTAARLLRL
jgi:aminocarboxymuconate-semialdehyde decarboxylase